MWDVEVAFDAAHRAVLSADKPLVYVCPPAGWALRPLVAQLAVAAELETLVLVPAPGDALDVADALTGLVPGYAHAATAVERSARLLRDGTVSVLVATPTTAQALLSQSSLHPNALRRTICAWPERMEDVRSVVDGILAESRGVQRIIVTADESDAADWIQRHARRAPVAVHSRPPEAPSATVRYATIGVTGRDAAARAAIESLNPGHTVVWNPTGERPERLGPGVTPAGGADPPEAALYLFADLPTSGLLARVPEGAGAVVLVRPAQLPYLRRVARLGAPVPLSREPDRLRERTAALRRRLRATLAEHDLDAELQALEPLLDEHDPTLIAAAALRESLASEDAGSEIPTWAKMHLSAGRKDRVGPRDVVGALVNAVGLTPDDIGRIDVQDRFTLVDVRPEDAARVAQTLTGQSLRGKRITARLDRR